MRITALVENESNGELKAKHGLSLYIVTEKHKILFDLGPDNTLMQNAEKLHIDLSQVDTVVISHGHLDHGGALGRFLAINNHAAVYIQKSAFLPHYTKTMGIPFSCGIKSQFQNHPQVKLLEGDYQIDEELQLITVKKKNRCYSPMNDCLYEEKEKDQFNHEQHLIIHGPQNALIMGCGHAGVVNIMAAAAQYKPALCVGGYHLMNPVTRKTVSETLMDQIVQALGEYPYTKFYTCHCTGQAAYHYMADRMPNLRYLACGESVTL